MKLITYYRPISWSKFKLAVNCPRALQFDLQHVPRRIGSNFWMASGLVVQRVFELFYSRGLYQDEKARNAEVMLEIARRLLAAGWVEGELRSVVTYPSGADRNTLEQRVFDNVSGGFRALQAEGLLDSDVRVEQGLRASVGNLSLFGKLDFIAGLKPGETWPPAEARIYDGKATAKQQDKRQLLFYALVAKSFGLNVTKLAFIYYATGQVQEIPDLDNAILSFVQSEDYQRGGKLFSALKTGVATDFPATPERYLCQYCDWEYQCPKSAYSEAVQHGIGIGLSGFDSTAASIGSATRGSGGTGTSETGEARSVDSGTPSPGSEYGQSTRGTPETGDGTSVGLRVSLEAGSPVCSGTRGGPDLELDLPPVQRDLSRVLTDTNVLSVMIRREPTVGVTEPAQPILPASRVRPVVYLPPVLEKSVPGPQPVTATLGPAVGQSVCGQCVFGHHEKCGGKPCLCVDSFHRKVTAVDGDGLEISW